MSTPRYVPVTLNVPAWEAFRFGVRDNETGALWAPQLTFRALDEALAAAERANADVAEEWPTDAGEQPTLDEILAGSFSRSAQERQEQA